MSNSINRLLLKLKFSLLGKLKANYHPSFNLSHSQFGEDMLLRFLTKDITNGFYVDIGAHHPVYISNTYHFYCKGWRGINIDAAPGSMNIFKTLRPKDINLEACIAPQGSPETKFFIFEQPAFNTCNTDMAQKAISQGVKLVKEVKLPAISVSDIFDSYLPKDTSIDLMNIDIEGLDEQILMSNDWNRYQPKILVFEKHSVNIEDVPSLPIMKYLTQFGYELVAKLGPSLVLQKSI